MVIKEDLYTKEAFKQRPEQCGAISMQLYKLGNIKTQGKQMRLLIYAYL